MLIAVEGNVGVGKSTLVQCIANQMNMQVTNWNSTELINPLIKRLRSENKLNSALLYEYLQLADFSIRYSNFINNYLTSDIICDRYVYTIIVRSLIRDIEEKHLKLLCEQYIKPDIIFYLYSDGKECLKRIKQRGIPTNDMWTIGMEINLKKFDFNEELFLEQQRKSDILYRKILQNENNVYYIDTCKEIEDVVKIVQNIIQQKEIKRWEN